MKHTVLKKHYQLLVRFGRFRLANRILKFMVNGHIKLNLSDIDDMTDNILHHCNYASTLDKRSGYITYHNKLERCSNGE